MNFSSFFKLVEIQTKVASVLPFLFGTLYVIFAFDTFDTINALLMFLSLLIFDMATTALNNYIDYKTAIKKDGYGYESHNAIVSYNLNPKIVLFIIIFMVGLASTLGFVLFLRTDWIVLIIGIIAFLVGIFYSFGPIPISRTPFGEIFSGITMGFLIPFLSIYIHLYNQGLIQLSFTNSHILLNMNLAVLFSLFIVTIPLIAGIANIMLANNICDIDDDIVNKRYTLPIYIGKKKALILFEALYYISFITIIASVFMKILPITSLICLFAIIPLKKHISAFKLHQSKGETFVFAVKNFLIMSLLYNISLILALLITLLNNIIV
ncbi:MAG: 1,4-dihydroxy-2-naphthoate polyprenyltransferase [Cellulosilyticaceae bacterium]